MYVNISYVVCQSVDIALPLWYNPPETKSWYIRHSVHFTNTKGTVNAMCCNVEYITLSPEVSVMFLPQYTYPH